MRWIALLLMIGCIGCTPGPRTKILMPSLTTGAAPAWHEAAKVEVEGLIMNPINNITFGEGIDPELKRALIYKYGESYRAMYYYPLYVVVN